MTLGRVRHLRRRVRVLVKGVVQGVGFRPYIYQLAHSHNLKGWVLNSSQGVIIEVEGEDKDIDIFLENLKPKAPPRASIESINVEKMPLENDDTFVIKESVEEEGKFILISPDISICDKCLHELFDPQDRRYRYPFINCTNCGPRFTIIEEIPYDRPKTTMKKFIMCPDCQREYDDPLNRRFHAQPNACPVCGPHLELWSIGSGHQSKDTAVRFSPVNNEDPITEAIEMLREGKIVAIKGLGGFHIACDAQNDEAVKRLRDRKRRFGKPLAVMLLDINEVKKYCYVDAKEEVILKSPQRPIVLLLERPNSNISRLVAPRNNYMGIMLPYTPLHYILLKESNMALVMTSGNISEEPIAMENEEAFRRLGHIADGFLLHNREIYSRYDDSVVRSTDEGMVMIRRARSFAPYPLRLPFKFPQILACGPELKNTFCLTKDEYAFVSQHIGDMENLETLEHFGTTLALYKGLFRIDPKIVAYDLHPEYLSTKFALELSGVKHIGVQHHHAHIVSVMIEHGLKDKVIGVSFDGTGYGTDGTIWGGEFLVSDWSSFRRAGNLRYLPMPGGAAAIERPYRMAFSYLYSFFGDDILNKNLNLWKRIDAEEREVIIGQLRRNINSPLTSSSGRLFDAVSSILGVRDVVDYEGQAAIELEMIAQDSEEGSYGFDLNPSAQKNSSLTVDTEPVIRGVLADQEKGVSSAVISAKFHNTVAEFCLAVCKKVRENEGISTVALSGGVFQNLYLTTKLERILEENDFKVFINQKVPTNDGGISLGQVVVAYAKISS